MAGWVPQLLTSDQSSPNLSCQETNLVMFEADPYSFVERFLTQDECWVHHFEPETIHAAKTLDFFCYKEGQGGVISRKDDDFVFWNAEDSVLIAYLNSFAPAIIDR